MKRKAFTLIELLVVIAIIAILAAILFPVFAAAREKARQSACASNLKQLNLGLIQYVQDYDETYPGFVGFSCNNNNGWQSNGLWGNEIYPYVKSTGVFLCPSNTKVGNAAYSYMMNALLGAGPSGVYRYGNNQGFNCGVTLAKLAYPDKTISLFEGNSVADKGCVGGVANGIFPNCTTQVVLGSYMVYQNEGGYTAWVGSGVNNMVSSYSYDIGPYCAQLHSGGTNLSFCDGHVKWVNQNVLLGMGYTMEFGGYQNGTANWHHNGVLDMTITQ